MIVEIEINSEYGKIIGGSINQIFNMKDEPSSVFAHSMQDALEWLDKQPLFVEADKNDNGRCAVITSKWIVYEPGLEAILAPEYRPHNDAEYTRQVAVITPRNTIYETSGYK